MSRWILPSVAGVLAASLLLVTRGPSPVAPVPPVDGPAAHAHGTPGPRPASIPLPPTGVASPPAKRRVRPAVDEAREGLSPVSWEAYETTPPAHDEFLVAAAPAEDEASFQANRRADFEVRQSAFAAQGVDRAFRDDVTRTLEGAVVGAPDEGVSVVGTDCRETACRLELAADDALAIQDFLERLQLRVGWSPDIAFDVQEVPGVGVTAAAIVPGP